MALLKEPAAAARKQATAGDLVGVVEIIHKSPMTEEKVNELNAAKARGPGPRAHLWRI